MVNAYTDLTLISWTENILKRSDYLPLNLDELWQRVQPKKSEISPVADWSLIGKIPARLDAIGREVRPIFIQ